MPHPSPLPPPPPGCVFLLLRPPPSRAARASSALGRVRGGRRRVRRCDGRCLRIPAGRREAKRDLRVDRLWPGRALGGRFWPGFDGVIRVGRQLECQLPLSRRRCRVMVACLDTCTCLLDVVLWCICNAFFFFFLFCARASSVSVSGVVVNIVIVTSPRAVPHRTRGNKIDPLQCAGPVTHIRAQSFGRRSLNPFTTSTAFFTTVVNCSSSRVRCGTVVPMMPLQSSGSPRVCCSRYTYIWYPLFREFDRSG